MAAEYVLAMARLAANEYAEQSEGELWSTRGCLVAHGWASGAG